MTRLNPNIIDPAYVQITKKDAATILGMSTRTFDNVRLSDPDCPKGFKESDTHSSPLKFRLSDIYTYSELRMSRAIPAIENTDESGTGTP